MARIELYPDEHEWGWRLRGDNGLIVNAGESGFSGPSEAAAAAREQYECGCTPIVEVGPSL